MSGDLFYLTQEKNPPSPTRPKKKEGRTSFIGKWVKFSKMERQIVLVLVATSFY